MAAQIATFPLAVYCFHQFPNYFLLSNLVALPLIGVILYLGIGTLLLSPIIPWLAKSLVWVMEAYSSFLVDSLNFIEKLPYSYVDGLVLTKSQMLLLYGLIFVMGYSLIQKRIKPMFLSVILLTTMVGIDWVNHHKNISSVEIIQVSEKESYKIFRKGLEAAIVLDDDIINNMSFMKYALDPFVRSRNIKRVVLIPRSMLALTGQYEILEVISPTHLWFNNRLICLEDEKCH
jgi:competence protein ComEC